MTVHSFGNIDEYQRKRELQHKLETILLALAKLVANPTMRERIGQFREHLRPLDCDDEGYIPGGTQQKERGHFLCRIDNKEACLLVLLRFAVMEWWSFQNGGRELYEPIIGMLEQVVERYRQLKVVGSVRDGYTFDVLAELAGASDE
jgi:hypothetical protein